MTLDRSLHHPNALGPTVVRPGGRDKLVRPLKANAISSIVLTPGGIVMLFRLVVHSNALAPIVLSTEGEERLTDTRLVQSANA